MKPDTVTDTGYYPDQLPPQPPSYPPKAEWDFPHQMRVTLWITTAIHLDTRSVMADPIDRPHR